jgi:phosphohistidine phosphatase
MLAPGKEATDAVRQIWLLRHAKSSWDDPSLADVDRPLSSRGVRAAAAMAAHLATLDTPRLVLCSVGLRTRQTLAAVLPSLGAPLEIQIEPDLYTFDADVLIRRLRRLDGAVSSVMVVGHNPALEELATALSATSNLRERLDQKFPTAALATIELPDGQWATLGDGAGTITRFVTPSDLAAATPPRTTTPPR